MDLMKRLSKAKTSLILEHPFIGSVALNMPMTLSDEVPTAATNGKRVLYNPEFIEPLTDEELKFLVAHECMHPMLEHNYRRNGRDPKKWNKAALASSSRVAASTRPSTTTAAGRATVSTTCCQMVMVMVTVTDPADPVTISKTARVARQSRLKRLPSGRSRWPKLRRPPR